MMSGRIYFLGQHSHQFAVRRQAVLADEFAAPYVHRRHLVLRVQEHDQTALRLAFREVMGLVGGDGLGDARLVLALAGHPLMRIGLEDLIHLHRLAAAQHLHPVDQAQQVVAGKGQGIVRGVRKGQ